MSQIFNKLYEQSFIDFYMSNAMWWNCAQTESWAYANLISLDCTTEADTCAAIYNDPNYGMGSVRNLRLWVRAADDDVDAKDIISRHYWNGIDYQL